MSDERIQGGRAPGERMSVVRIGFTPIKGARHREHSQVHLSIDGPIGDRRFALVDLSRGRVLRTVENPRLLATSASWADGVLSVDMAGITFSAEVFDGGQPLELEYWGRPAKVEVIDGPWARAYSTLLEHDVVLTRSIGYGQVVYGSSVTLVTTGQLRELAAKLGHAVDPRRFRSTFVIDSDCPDPGREWQGHDLQLGAARVTILGEVDRCAIIDFDAETGASGTRLLSTLAGYRMRHGVIEFGMFAEVCVPGVVRRGDPASLIR